jgi:hypothetical protein
MIACNLRKHQQLLVLPNPLAIAESLLSQCAINGRYEAAYNICFPCIMLSPAAAMRHMQLGVSEHCRAWSVDMSCHDAAAGAVVRVAKPCSTL